MGEYMTLVGAEQVQTAANRMQSAADDMKDAASSFDGSVVQLVRALDDHAARIEAAMSFDRAPETSRRQSAVELLLKAGYVWHHQRGWEKPDGP